jgi:hypothetical protein
MVQRSDRPGPLDEAHRFRFTPSDVIAAMMGRATGAIVPVRLPGPRQLAVDAAAFTAAFVGLAIVAARSGEFPSCSAAGTTHRSTRRLGYRIPRSQSIPFATSCWAATASSVTIEWTPAAAMREGATRQCSAP